MICGEIRLCSLVCFFHSHFCFLLQLSHIFLFNYKVCDPTVGVDFFARLLQVNDGTRIKLQLWDTAGILL